MPEPPVHLRLAQPQEDEAAAVMSALEDHRWPVRVVNTASGAARAWRHMPRPVHFGWVLCMVMYTFIGAVCSSGMAEFAAWDLFFGVAWTFPLSLADRIFRDLSEY